MFTLHKKVREILSSFLIVTFFITPFSTFALESPKTFSSTANYYGEDVLIDDTTSIADYISSTGAFGYTIPINVPQGVNNVTPNIELHYSSQNLSNGSIYGHGWSDSIPYIERQNKTGVNNMYDDFFFSSSLSGDLTPTSINKNGKGTYTARQEASDFLKYQFVNDDSWEVYMTDGTVYVFGKDADSRLENPNNTKQITRWYLSEMRDSKENTIVYQYQKETAKVYPDKIIYTGHKDRAGDYEIKFMYVDTSSYTSYASGYEVITDKVVDEIKVLYKGQEVMLYDFEHIISADSKRPLLSSYKIIGYGSETTTSATETFHYSESNLVFEKDEDFPALPVESSTDLWKNTSNQFPILFLDHDKDGIAEIYGTYNQNNGDSRYYTYRWNQMKQEWKGFVDSIRPYIARQYFRDGRITFGNLESEFGVEQFSLLDSEKRSEDYYDTDGNKFYTHPVVTVLADLNGDGLSDLLQVNDDRDGAVYFRDSNTELADEWQRATENQLWHMLGDNYAEGTAEVRTPDLNGDGLSDFVTSRDIKYNNGSGSTKLGGATPGTTPWTEKDPMEPYQFSDMNGDGILDILLSNGNTNQVDLYIQKVDGTFELHPAGAELESFAKYDNPPCCREYVATGRWIYDIDADGLDDMLVSRDESNGVDNKYALFNKGTQADKLISVETMSGASVQAGYERTTKQYNKDAELLHPNLSTPLDVVVSLEVHDGLGSTTKYEYVYENGKHYHESSFNNGFAGFERIIQKDGFTGKQIVTYYHQGDGDNSLFQERGDGFLLVGKPYKKEVLGEGPDDRFSTTYFDWEVTPKSLEINSAQEPQNIRVEHVFDDTVILEWDTPDSISAHIEGYVVERADADSGDFIEIQQERESKTNQYLVDKSVLASSTYTYRVAAVNALGTSQYSSELQVTTKESSEFIAGNSPQLIISDENDVLETGGISFINATSSIGIQQEVDSGFYTKGSGLKLDGELFQDAVLGQETSLELSLWIRPDITGFTRDRYGTQRLWSMLKKNSTAKSVAVSFQKDVVQGSAYSDIGSISFYSPSVDMDNAEWKKMQVRYSFDNNRKRLKTTHYVNGELVSSREKSLPSRYRSATQVVLSMGDMIIGDDSSPTNLGYHGFFDDIAITHGLLSNEKQTKKEYVLELYSSLKSKNDLKGVTRNDAYLVVPETVISARHQNETTVYSAITNKYAHSFGGLIESTDWGEVNYSPSTGKLSDSKEDARVTKVQYAIKKFKEMPRLEESVVLSPTSVQEGWHSIDTRGQYDADALSITDRTNTWVFATGLTGVYPAASSNYSTDTNLMRRGYLEYSPLENGLLEKDDVVLGATLILATDNTERDGTVTLFDSTCTQNMPTTSLGRLSCNLDSEPISEAYPVSRVDRQGLSIEINEEGTFQMTENLVENKKFSLLLRPQFDSSNELTTQESDENEISFYSSGVDSAEKKPRLDVTVGREISEDVYRYLPSKTVVYKHDGRRISEKRNYYDKKSYRNIGSQGLVTKTKTWLNTNDNWVENQFDYNERGLIKKITDERGHETHMDYDKSNLFIDETKNELGHTVSYKYDFRVGDISETKDENNVTHKIVFDGLGRIIKEYRTSFDGSLIKKREVSFVDTSMPRSMTVSEYNQEVPVNSHTYLDGLGRVIQVKTETTNSGELATITKKYDRAGRLTTTTVPYISTESEYVQDVPSNVSMHKNIYDVFDRVTSVETPFGIHTYTYETPFDVKKTNPKGISQVTMMDVRGNTVGITEDAEGEKLTTLYEYDDYNNLVKVVDAENNIRSFTFDSLGRQIKAELPHKEGAMPATYVYEYDQAGNKIAEILPDGTELLFTYDELDRLSAKDSDRSTQVDAIYLYDEGDHALGKLTTVETKDQIKNYTYDQAGNLSNEEIIILGFVATENDTQEAESPDEQTSTTTNTDDVEVEVVSSTSSEVETTEVISTTTQQEVVTEDQTDETATTTQVEIDLGEEEDSPITWIHRLFGVRIAHADETATTTEDIIETAATSTNVFVQADATSIESVNISQEEEQVLVEEDIIEPLETSIDTDTASTTSENDTQEAESPDEQTSTTTNADTIEVEVVSSTSSEVEIEVASTNSTTTQIVEESATTTQQEVVTEDQTDETATTTQVEIELGEEENPEDVGPVNQESIDNDLPQEPSTQDVIITKSLIEQSDESMGVFNTSYLYDAWGNLISVLYPDNSLVDYVYYNTGELKQVLRQGVVQATYEYNHLGEVTKVLLANGVQEEYGYDSEKEYLLSSKKTSLGEVSLQDVSYVYDSIGNMTSIMDIGSEQPLLKLYQYDDLNRLTLANHVTAEDTNDFLGIQESLESAYYEYNQALLERAEQLQETVTEEEVTPTQVAVSTSSYGRSSAKTNEQDHNFVTQNSTTLLSGRYKDDITYRTLLTYDKELGQTDSVNNAVLSLTGYSHQARRSSAYDFYIQIFAQLEKDGYLTTVPVSEKLYTYGKSSIDIPVDSEYVTDQLRDGGSVAFVIKQEADIEDKYASRRYQYFRVVGDNTQLSFDVVERTQVPKYAPEDLPMPTPVNTDEYLIEGVENVSEEYEYSSGGNILSHNGVAYLYENNSFPHAATTYGENTYSYDANGNLETKNTGSSTDVLSYDWNDRLEKIQRDNVEISRYSYDDARQRISKTVAGRTDYFLNEYSEYSADGYDTHVFGGGNRISSIDPLENITYNHQDHLRSNSLQTDDIGSVVSSVIYKSFGSELVRNGSKTSNYTYTDEYRDDESGLMYYNSRYYDTDLKRFTSVDPWAGELNDPQTQNKYSYVGNNPIKYNDPTGECYSGDSCEGLKDGVVDLPGQAVDSAKFIGGMMADGLIAPFNSAAQQRNEQRSVQYVEGLVDYAGQWVDYFDGTMSQGEREYFTMNQVPGAFLTLLGGKKVAGAGSYSNQVLNSWNKGTFDSKTQSINYHVEKHGYGKSVEQYTRDGNTFFQNNSGSATSMQLRNGDPGLKITNRSNNYYGIYDTSGRQVTHGPINDQRPYSVE